MINPYSILTTLLLSTCLLSTFYSYSQNLNLPPLQELENSLTTFIEIERDAKLRSFDQLKSGEWQDVLPALGVAYTPAGDPRPSLSWSPLQILDRKENKKKRKLARESIYLSYEIMITDKLYKLRQLYADYMIDYQQIQTVNETLAIDEQLYAITETKYKENIIKPSEYLSAKKAITLSRANVKLTQMNLLKQKNKVLYEGKWE